MSTVGMMLQAFAVNMNNAKALGDHFGTFMTERSPTTAEGCQAGAFEFLRKVRGSNCVAMAGLGRQGGPHPQRGER